MHISVFVSSRFEEFRDVRAALCEQLEANGVFAALALDDGSVAPVSVADRSVGTVADAEVVVLLLGSTYVDEPNVEFSLTHREYRRARELQRTLLVYESAAASDTSRDPRAPRRDRSRRLLCRSMGALEPPSRSGIRPCAMLAVRSPVLPSAGASRHPQHVGLQRQSARESDHPLDPSAYERGFGGGPNRCQSVEAGAVRG